MCIWDPLEQKMATTPQVHHHLDGQEGSDAMTGIRFLCSVFCIQCLNSFLCHHILSLVFTHFYHTDANEQILERKQHLKRMGKKAQPDFEEQLNYHFSSLLLFHRTGELKFTVSQKAFEIPCPSLDQSGNEPRDTTHSS